MLRNVFLLLLALESALENPQNTISEYILKFYCPTSYLKNMLQSCRLFAKY